MTTIEELESRIRALEMTVELQQLEINRLKDQDIVKTIQKPQVKPEDIDWKKYGIDEPLEI